MFVFVPDLPSKKEKTLKTSVAYYDPSVCNSKLGIDV